jgi:outer membrane autotransporter protein
MYILFRGRRVRCVGRRKAPRAGAPRPAARPACLVRVKPQRASLLLGTALASTLLLANLVAPTPALAADCVQPVSPNPINEYSNTESLTCVNTEIRRGDAVDVDAIRLETGGDGLFIDLNNSGLLYSYAVGASDGIHTQTNGLGSHITILNTGDIEATSDGIYARTEGDQSQVEINNYARIEAPTGFNVQTIGANSGITIVNTGDIDSQNGAIDIYTGGDNSDISVETSGNLYSYGGPVIEIGTSGMDSDVLLTNRGPITTSDNAGAGIYVDTNQVLSSIRIANYGAIDVYATGIRAKTYYDDSTIDIFNYASITSAIRYGIQAETDGERSGIFLINTGAIHAEDDIGIVLQTNALDSRIQIFNYGDITYSLGPGIRALTYGGTSPVGILNTGDITTGEAGDSHGMWAQTNEPDSEIGIINGGDIHTVFAGSNGIRTLTQGDNSPIGIINGGNIRTEGNESFAIYAHTGGVAGGVESRIDIFNTGDLRTFGQGSFGIIAETVQDDSPVDIETSGDITTSGYGAHAIRARTQGERGDLDIRNYGNITTTDQAGGIVAYTIGADSPLTILNTGTITTPNPLVDAISAAAAGAASTVMIDNRGGAFGGAHGINAYSNTGTTIENRAGGSISAASLFAINVKGGGAALIRNLGVVSGFVDLTEQSDLVENYGTWNARLDSDFQGGDDTVTNTLSGIVRTAHNGGATEITRFNGLENFNNSGLVTLVDGGEGDLFSLTSNFNAGSGVLAVDAFLGGPGSVADVMQVGGNVTGQTALRVNNTSPSGGALNREGITVVEVEGNANANNFFLENGPIDAGFFVYELFFEPGATNIFELRSGAPGSSAFILPQLITASQDIWHATAGTWFDRSADLRVLLNGGGPGMAAGATYGAQPMRAAPPLDQVGYSAWGQSVLNTPAIWAKGSGTWLDRDGSESSSAFGSTFNFNLNRDLDVFQLETGLDMGVRGIFGERDTLVFGVLGGFIAAGLDYNKLTARFDYEGGEVGGYATYLNGGWFVDTLVKVDFLAVETTGAIGLPDSFDSTTWGVRADTGYRFGGWRGGIFLEPLGTIEVIWADIDNFATGGNRIAFDDDANVRGRLGLRGGTSYAVFSGITMEPFVIGSVWGNLSGDNKATLNSVGTPFLFTDDIPDVWGEASLGVNFFSPNALTALYAKADVTFGDDIEGFAGKGGVRISW